MRTRRRSYWAVVLLCVSQLAAPVIAAQTQATSPPAASGDRPIDIQANEQEFAGDTVLAKGNVKVTYKDCIVYSPVAKLFRTPDGQPQKAIFTGHPHLIQGINKMDADTLEFEIASGQMILDGHAHSEVSSADDDKKADSQDKDKAKNEDGTDKVADSGTNDGPASDTTTTEPKPKKKAPPPKNTKATSSEMIITDADHQEYIKESGKFDALGHVHVKTGDIVVHSDKLRMVYGTDNRPEAAIFAGSVNATQFDNNTIADNMTYFLSTQRLQATGNVRSKVIQKADPKKGAIGPKASDAVLDPSTLGDLPDDQIIFINSDAQDYTKDTGRIAAQGNVHVKCGEISGFGPHVLVTRSDDGAADKILFTGRSQINQPGRRWIGDRITLNVIDHRVLAEGNTRATIVQTPTKTVSAQTAPSSSSSSEQLAKTDSGSSSQLSSSRSPESERPQ